MPSRNDARVVRITISSTGEVLRVRDPVLSRPVVFSMFPKSGSTYGWDLLPHIESGQIQRPQLISTVPAAPNATGNGGHRHTLQPQGAHLIKLDCGYWGNYDVTKPQQGRQRDFGLIEGANAWLCSYETVNPNNPPGILPSNGTLAAALVTLLGQHGLYIAFKSHATIPPVGQVSPDANKLYICFPDLHLPEQWPDLYPTAQRAAPGYRRAALRRLLREAQCRPGAANDSLLTQQHLNSLQTALDQWEAGGNQNFSMPFPVSVSIRYETIRGPDGPTSRAVYTTNTYTPNPAYSRDEVLAEKAHLDRELQGRSAWFYPVSLAPNGYTAVASPFAGGPGGSESDPPLDCVADDPVSCTVGSAVDLANFLFLLRTLRTQHGANRVNVVQVGDMYELWMNREFMYKDAPRIPADDIGQGAMTVETVAPLMSTEHSYREAFQLRQDRGWSDAQGAHAAKRYGYHGWARGQLYYRHQSSGQIPGSKAGRLSQELLRRIKAVESWGHRDSNPSRQSAANHSELIQPLRTWIGQQAAGFFQRQNLRGETVICWHRLLLQLMLEECGARAIHGNHDGYRSDAQLLASAKSATATSITPAPGMPAGNRRLGTYEWISDPGVWVEHGHRWDYYNRDGVAMGAGMTNIVYYHNHELIEASQGMAAQVQKQEQCFFQPGAAQWFLLVNYGQRQQWYGQNVQPFGVFVSGHTHTPDLVKIFFELSAVDSARETVGEAVDSARQTASDAWDSTTDAAGRAARAVRSYLPF